ncbi:histidinol dehydrogenase [Enterococcus dispar]|uniref:histidinol dehydrogenase n=1 Tax=Enterococcus dispar TaxID=44009 RepID=UPI00232A82E6|nr:histidinol dehydrogenase [Enterococcus dispar]WCG32240.1 histidinol dehydrogenase [Enterococcus dispar]
MIKILQQRDLNLNQIRTSASGSTAAYTQVVQEIIQNVQVSGDEALKEYTKKFDGAALTTFKVTAAEIEAAITACDPAFLTVLKKAHRNIAAFHEKQKDNGFMLEKQGAIMGQRVIPLAKVGIYVPGGTAAYPSTVLMNVIPAKIAGVKKIVLVTPPQPDGTVTPAILAAAKIAGADEIYKVGGAQAVAALAYGTQTIPAVDKVTGPGNIYVATAKRLVYGKVDIDMIAGPSDILIIADKTAKPAYLAADLLAQAEHDVNAQAILVTTSQEIAEATAQEVRTQTANAPRREIMTASLKKNGCIIVVPNLAAAFEITDEVAPEHLELCIEEPFAALDAVKNAGSVFLGHHTPEVLGDYLAGPNHTLPTEGTARFYSPLSVADFQKRSSYLYYGKEALKDVSDDVILFAKTEGLFAHANSIKMRKGV